MARDSNMQRLESLARAAGLAARPQYQRHTKGAISFYVIPPGGDPVAVAFYRSLYDAVTNMQSDIDQINQELKHDTTPGT